MKIAIFHQFLDNIGGAEKVVLTLAHKLNCDVFTTNIDKEKIAKMGFSSVLERIHSLGKVPLRPPLRQQMAFYFFSKLKLKNYDFYIIGGDWAIAAAKYNHPNLWYTHSGLNEIWGFQKEIEENILKAWQIIPYRIWIKFLRKKIKHYVKFVDKIVSNSLNTKEKIKEYYQREAQVIYPPIETSLFFFKPHRNYWLSVNRLIKHKRIEIQLETLRLLPEEKLIIVGSYERGVPHMEEYKNYLIKTKPPNVEIKHWVDENELKNLYAYSKGLLATSLNEDFGMNAVEAMACGKPVIAPQSGGYKESVINGKTGILVKELNPQEFVKAINEVNKNLNNNPLFYRENCIDQAKMFGVDVFIKKIKELIY